MAKSKLVVNYYKNVDKGWHEWWWAMSIIILREEKLKEVITIDMAQERLCQLNRFWWFIVEYLYTPQKLPKKKTWVCFMDFFWQLPQNVQVLIIGKLMGIQKHCAFNINQ